MTSSIPDTMDPKGKQQPWVAYLQAFGAMAVLVFTVYTQGFVLLNLIGVPAASVGSAISRLSLLQELTVLASAFLWGALSDVIGQRISGLIGWLLFTVAVQLVIYSTGNLTTYLIARILFGLSFSNLTTTLSALIAENAPRERSASFHARIGVSCSLGAFMGSAFLGSICPSRFCLRPTYQVVAIGAGIWGLTIALATPRRNRSKDRGLDNGKISSSHFKSAVVVETNFEASAKMAVAEQPMTRIDEENQLEHEEILGFYQVIKVTIHTVSSSYWLIIALFASFTARAVSAGLTIFIPVIYAIRSMEGSEIDLDESDSTTNPCGELNYKQMLSGAIPGYATGTQVMVVLHVATLLVAIVLSRISRINGPKMDLTSLIQISLFGSLVYLAMGFAITTDTIQFAIATAALAGTAEIGIILTAQALFTHASRQHSEVIGCLSGAFTIAGSLGVLFITLFGGVLLDAVGYSTPFLLLSGICLSLAAAAAALTL